MTAGFGRHHRCHTVEVSNLLAECCPYPSPEAIPFDGRTVGSGNSSSQPGAICSDDARSERSAGNALPFACNALENLLAGKSHVRVPMVGQ